MSVVVIPDTCYIFQIHIIEELLGIHGSVLQAGICHQGLSENNGSLVRQ